MPNELVRYGVAGILNTIAGYLAFLFALHLLGLNVMVSNVLSYAVGLSVAYVLNRAYVFQKSHHSRRTILRFVISFLLAFGLNAAVLYSLVHFAGLRPEIAQVFAMGCYTIAFYLLNRWYVWTT